MQLYSGFKICEYKYFIGEISDYQEVAVLTSRESSNNYLSLQLTDYCCYCCSEINNTGHINVYVLNPLWA